MSKKSRLTLNDIPKGTVFILSRTGCLYVKGEREVFQGRTLTRFVAYPVGQSEDKKIDLSLHCEVKLT